MKKALLISLGAVLIACGIFTALTTIIITFLLPETFAATTRLTNPSMNAMPTEVQKIQSHAVLEQVTTELNLAEEWGRKYKQPGALSPDRCYAILRGSIEVLQQRGAGLIEIRVLSDDRNEAALIANRIATVYRATTPGTTIIEAATPPLKPSRPNTRLNILFALVVGVAFAGSGIISLIIGFKKTPTGTASRSAASFLR